ncbi:hypothetical protein BDV38DRAFT_290947 [Aspergillus pseudotamarii]|uniref:Zn(2)-C6 fungal-type domain-containing protein n=1 Tax=Aspergillus pseudotamarii TaxID=132259 RepID=A0A5N6SAP1_ASPPS|nr:uncharacterized protein BDV38DRAFT_290947 [Aspergillus pseudotamarii]KAE8130929.1 hypothetical protein BDV38DRAFT_290947 [Aspergillus pseudotamarii]
MSMSGEQRSRQACEPCRRKKSKCTAERPVCSFCERLNVQCVYLPREQAKSDGQASRVTKSKSSKDRFRTLESQVNDIYHILNSLSNRNDAATPEASTARSGEPREDPSTEVPNMLPRVGSSNNRPCFAQSYLEPPVEVLGHFMEVYRTRIHFQPLPLFNLEGLRDRLANSPRFLLHSFLALSLNFGSHEFYRGREQQAVQLYTRSAEDAAMKLAVEGIPKIEVIESLCLLAVKDLIGQKPARAWMTIGTASRLDTLRRLTRHYTSDPQTEDRSARCHWSVFILEKAFSPQVLDLSSSQDTPDYPLSAPLPSSLPTYRDENCPPDLHVSEEVNKDLGINAYHIEMVSVWGDLTRYLHGIRSGNVETPWLPESTHAKLSVRLYKCEAELPQRHLLRNVCFSKRSIAEIMQQQEYWSPWLAMQMLSHASPAILNHPFLHLVAMRGGRGVPQSRLFLQQTVDLALFHSGWVFQFIQFCENLQYEINDPLIGHAVAATATIPWLFQFARDPKVSKKAYDDLGKCERFLSRISSTWPHISRKVCFPAEPWLRTSHSSKSSNTCNITMISFQPQMFWELLDPKVCQVPQGDPTSQDARMRVTTHFVHPLLDEQPPPPNPAGNAMYSFPPSPEDLEQVCLDEIFAHFPRDEFYWLQS